MADRNGIVSILVKIKDEGVASLKSVGDKLDDIKVKAAAFAAAMTANLGLAVKQYADQEEAVNKLEASLKAQGLQVDKLSVAYQQLAADLQNTTAFGDDQIISALALGQSLAGNIPITKELTEATLNFAAATGTDLESAFSMVGKSIGSNVNALARNGIELDANMNASQKMTKITEELTKKFDGAAEAQVKGLGSLKLLKNQVGEVYEAVGKQLAPAIEVVTSYLIDLAKTLQDDTYAKWAAIIGVAATAVVGLGAALGTIVAVAPKVITGLSLILTPIAAITAGVAALLVAWKTDFGSIQEVSAGVVYALRSVFANFFTDVGKLASDFGALLKSVFTFDSSAISAAFDTLKTDLLAVGAETKAAYDRGYISTANLRKALNKDVAADEQKQTKMTSAEAAKAIAEENAKKISNRRVVTDEEKKQLEDLKKKQLDVENQITAKKLATSQEEYITRYKYLQALANDERSSELERQQAVLDLDKLRLEMVEHQKQANKEAAHDMKEHWKDVGDAVQKFTSNGLQGAVSGAIGMLTNTFLPGFGDAASSVFDMLSKDSGEFTELISKLFSADFLGNVMNNIVALLEKFPEILQGIIDYIVENMPALAQSLITAIIGNLPEILSALAKMFTDPKFIADLAAGIAKGVGNGFADATKDITEAIAQAFRDAWDAVKGIFKIDFGGGGGGHGGVLGKLGLAQGGFVPHLATGGFVPGFAGGGLIDNTLAALTPGEFVVNRASASANSGVLHAINQSNGRPVGGGSTVVNITVNGGLLGDAHSAKEFARAIDEQLYKLRLNRESRSFDSGLT